MERGAKVVGLLVVLALVAGGLWWWLRPAPVAEGVVFVGDSVTYMSFGDLEAELSSKRPDVLARIGYRSGDLLPLFQKTVRQRRAEAVRRGRRRLLSAQPTSLPAGTGQPGRLRPP